MDTGHATDSPRLILLPGVGADERLFEPQREAFPDCHTPGWLPPEFQPHKPPESLTHYAGRMAEAIRPLCAADRTVVIGGVSFGGMVAYEAARLLPVDCVVQMASCRSPSGVRALLRHTRSVASVVPEGTLRAAKAFSPLAVEMLMNLRAKQRRLFVDMFKASDNRFMKWALTSILAWQPSPPPDAPVWQIHGGRDLLLPVRQVNADEVIPEGGHMINITHPAQVNAFIHRAVASCV